MFLIDALLKLYRSGCLEEVGKWENVLFSKTKYCFTVIHQVWTNRSHGQVVRISAFDSIDLSSITELGETEDYRKMVITTSLVGVQHLKRLCGEKPASPCCDLGRGGTLRNSSRVEWYRQVAIINETNTQWHWTIVNGQIRLHNVLKK